MSTQEYTMTTHEYLKAVRKAQRIFVFVDTGGPRTPGIRISKADARLVADNKTDILKGVQFDGQFLYIATRGNH